MDLLKIFFYIFKDISKLKTKIPCFSNWFMVCFLAIKYNGCPVDMLGQTKESTYFSLLGLASVQKKWPMGSINQYLLHFIRKTSYLFIFAYKTLSKLCLIKINSVKYIDYDSLLNCLKDSVLMQVIDTVSFQTQKTFSFSYVTAITNQPNSEP